MVFNNQDFFFSNYCNIEDEIDEFTNIDPKHLGQVYNFQ